MKKKTVVSVTVVAMLFAVSLFFVGGTYARYASEFTGTASTSVAKWNVALAENSKAEEKMKLEFKLPGNENVAAGKIAPGVTAEATAEIDLTGTEVAVEFYADATEEAIQAAVAKFGMNAEDIDFSVKVTGAEGVNVTGTTGDAEDPYVIELPDNAAFNGTNGKITVTVTLKWTNQDEHNADDTKAGVHASTNEEDTFAVDVTLHVQQHIAE